MRAMLRRTEVGRVVIQTDGTRVGLGPFEWAPSVAHEVAAVLLEMAVAAEAMVAGEQADRPERTATGRAFAPQARLFDDLTEADLGRCDVVRVPARDDRMTLANGRTYEVGRVHHRVADGEVDVWLTDLETRDDIRDYGYLAGSPVRSDEEESRMLELRARLRDRGLEFDWEPTPREALPVFDAEGRKQFDERGFPKRGPAPGTASAPDHVVGVGPAASKSGG